MTINIQSNANGLGGEIQVGGQARIVLEDDGGVLLKGGTGAESAPAGFVGEFKQENPTAVALVNSQTRALASLVLTEGEWEVFGAAYFSTANSSTSVTTVHVATTVPTDPSVTSAIDGSSSLIFAPSSAINTGASGVLKLQAGIRRLMVTAPVTVTLSVLAAFTVAGLSAAGQITARRVR